MESLIRWRAGGREEFVKSLNKDLTENIIYVDWIKPDAYWKVPKELREKMQELLERMGTARSRAKSSSLPIVRRKGAPPPLRSSPQDSSLASSRIASHSANRDSSANIQFAQESQQAANRPIQMQRNHDAHQQESVTLTHQDRHSGSGQQGEGEACGQRGGVKVNDEVAVTAAELEQECRELMGLTNVAKFVKDSRLSEVQVLRSLEKGTRLVRKRLSW